MLIDVIEGNRVYIPCLYVVNKIDAITMEELEILDRIPNYVPISAYKASAWGVRLRGLTLRRGGTLTSCWR